MAEEGCLEALNDRRRRCVGITSPSGRMFRDCLRSTRRSRISAHHVVRRDHLVILSSGAPPHRGASLSRRTVTWQSGQFEAEVAALGRKRRTRARRNGRQDAPRLASCRMFDDISEQHELGSRFLAHSPRRRSARAGELDVASLPAMISLAERAQADVRKPVPIQAKRVLLLASVRAACSRSTPLRPNGCSDGRTWRSTSCAPRGALQDPYQDPVSGLEAKRTAFDRVLDAVAPSWLIVHHEPKAQPQDQAVCGFEALVSTFKPDGAVRGSCKLAPAIEAGESAGPINHRTLETVLCDPRRQRRQSARSGRSASTSPTIACNNAPK